MRQRLQGDENTGASDNGHKLNGPIPAVVAVGFALFLIFNTFTLWGGFPIGSLFGLEMHSVLRYWAIAMLAGMLITFLLGTFAARKPLSPRAIQIAAILAVILGVMGCFLLNEQFRDSLTALIIAASLFGVCNGLFYLLWEQVMTALPEGTVFKVILIATAFFPLTYFCIRLLGTVTIPMSIVLVISSGALLVFSLHRPHIATGTNAATSSLSSRTDTPSFAGTENTATPDYRAALHIMRGSLFCVGAIGFMTAITRSLALTLIPDYILVGSYALVGVVVSAALLLIIWFALKRPFDLPTFYKVVFPLATTILLAMSFVSAEWFNFISAFFYLLFTMVSSLIMLSGIQVARATDTSPVFCFGVLALACYLMVTLGTILGVLQLAGDSVSQTTILLVALLCVYLLSMVSVYIYNKRFDASLIGDPETDSAKIAATNAGDKVAEVDGQASLEAAQALMAQRCSALAARYQLSNRETEIMGLLIRGHDVRHIAKELFISENTVRYHSKNIYTKMDIHTKQELLALYEGE